MPLKVPQLDDRNFEQLLAEAKLRIPVHTPEWTNFNDSDPGITIVQLFAFMTENLLYRSNRIPEANRKKFLALLGIPLQPASPGRGIVVFRNDRGPVKPWPVEAGLELLAGKVPFGTRTGVCILPVTTSVFFKQPQPSLDEATQQRYQAMYESLRAKPTDQLQFYKAMPLEAPQTGKPLPWVDLADNLTPNGTIDRSLWVALVGPQNVPPASVIAAIAGQTLTLGIYPYPQCAGLVLEPVCYESKPVADPGLVFEIAAPAPSVEGKLAPPRYTRLNVEYAENVLEQPGIVQVTLPEYSAIGLWPFDPEEEGTLDYPPLVEDKELTKRIVTWIRIRLPKSDDQAANSAVTGSKQQAKLAWVGANAARVIQAVPVVNERLGVGTGAPDQVYKVANTPVFVSTVTDQAPDATPSGNFKVEVQNDNGGWDEWQRVDDLYAARASDKAYALDPESGEVSFGSGLRGFRPPLGRAIRVSYEYGGGPAGQVAIGAINKCAALPGGYKVENPAATWGAGQGEDTASGERNIPRYLKHRDRVVTASDFRDIALRTPGVDMGRVQVLPLFHPELFKNNPAERTWPGIVTLLVIPKFDPEQPDAPRPDRMFLQAVCQWLDSRRLLTTEIFVRGPEYVPIWASVGLVTLPGQVRELVHRNVQQAIREYLSPLTGGPPVAAAAATDPACVDPSVPAPNEPCPKLRGLGWPLNMQVRRLDLEAVATRVAGVRYIESIRLAAQISDGIMQTDVEQVPIAGLQLPRLVGISVREGPAEDMADLLGQAPADTTTTTGGGQPVAVPVLPTKC
jgi:hypothetical protein